MARGINVLVAQSGGPSPVINASLSGVIDACRDYPGRVGRILGAWHGLEGLLREELIDLSAQAPGELARLRRTPAAGAIGTCRFKLGANDKEDLDRILEVCRAQGVGYFFYVGGNDSMDTAARVAALARERGVELVVTGVPKTIDNDVGDPGFKLIDHTPGYGSAARYWACLIRDVIEENRGMCTSECVSVLQAMGRSAGFIPAAARLADVERAESVQIYVPESGHTLESLAENVNRGLREEGRCIVVVSEGFPVGSLGEAEDAFGHIEYGASRLCVAQVVAGYLNEQGLAARGQATWQVPGVLQRCTSTHASTVDLAEAYAVARQAVEIAMHAGGGWMATLLREPGEEYRVRYDQVALERVANSERQVPREWLTPCGTDVTDAFIRYARPLIGDEWARVELEGGLPRFARIERRWVEKQLPEYVPVKHREARGALR